MFPFEIEFNTAAKTAAAWEHTSFAVADVVVVAMSRICNRNEYVPYNSQIDSWQSRGINKNDMNHVNEWAPLLSVIPSLLFSNSIIHTVSLSLVQPIRLCVLPPPYQRFSWRNIKNQMNEKENSGR